VWTLIALALLGAALSGCSEPPAKTQIRNAIQAMVKAVEDKDRPAFAEHVSPEFEGGNGMNRRALAQMMLFEFRRNQRVGVYVVDTTIKVDGAWADVVLHVALTGGGQWLPERARYYRINTRWHRHEGSWRVRRARWKAVGAP